MLNSGISSSINSQVIKSVIKQLSLKFDDFLVLFNSYQTLPNYRTTNVMVEYHFQPCLKSLASKRGPQCEHIRT